MKSYFFVIPSLTWKYSEPHEIPILLNSQPDIKKYQKSHEILFFRNSQPDMINTQNPIPNISWWIPMENPHFGWKKSPRKSVSRTWPATLATKPPASWLRPWIRPWAPSWNSAGNGGKRSLLRLGSSQGNPKTGWIDWVETDPWFGNVWNMFILWLSIQLGRKHHPNWRTHSYFSEGLKHVETTNQQLVFWYGNIMEYLLIHQLCFHFLQGIWLIDKNAGICCGDLKQHWWFEAPFLISNTGDIFWLVVWNMIFFHILGIIIPTDFHIFQRGWNHQLAGDIFEYPGFGVFFLDWTYFVANEPRWFWGISWGTGERNHRPSI